MLRHITALSFLPPSKIPSAFDQIKPLMPLNAVELVQYFEENYVHGKIIRRRQLWSVYELIENGYPRTQNVVEGWHQWWGSLIGRAHVGVYSIIDEMQKEQHQTELQVESIIRDFLRGIAYNISLLPNTLKNTLRIELFEQW
ncbi:hypothetical protein C1646_776132 [Rhizophagus diaphanus]|nr:hypothetical protein C1646_776132 [Rhizophagus diaphanus] [Rhizophagus sp. MUCL 43196]